jgi:hypothetical protein
MKRKKNQSVNSAQSTFNPANGQWHTVNKSKLAKVLRTDNSSLQENLQNYIQRVHDFAQHATHAIKYFILTHPEQTTLSEDHVEVILYLLNQKTYSPRNTRKRELKEILEPIVRQYQELISLPLFEIHPAQQTINFLVTSLFTNLVVNVQQHFMSVCIVK